MVINDRTKQKDNINTFSFFFFFNVTYFIKSWEDKNLTICATVARAPLLGCREIAASFMLNVIQAWRQEVRSTSLCLKHIYKFGVGSISQIKLNGHIESFGHTLKSDL